MVAQALYLKYRPQTFEEVVGQEPITRTLCNALRQDKVRHAYLFTGPRGTGKTTTARLLAKAVNCQAPPEEAPCNVCPLCLAVNEGRLLDLIEIDAASNRGIDEIRDIREKVGFRPNEGRFKIYVLDEAHMLTEPAFNALLKTLEEPPPHVIFALVTTDPHKIPATISSRCQRFDFRRIPLQAIVDRLAFIAGQEGVEVEPDALELMAHHGTGALRDAISLLDQLTSYGAQIDLEQVQMVLGTVASEGSGKLVARLAERDAAGGLDVINRAVGDGADPRQFGREVVEYLRGVLLVQQGAGTHLLNATAEQAAEMEAMAGRIPPEQLLRSIHLFNEAVTDVKSGLQVIPQLPLEMALVQSILEPAAGQQSASPSSPTSSAAEVTPAGPVHVAKESPPVAAKPKTETRRVEEPAVPTPAQKPEPRVREGTQPVVASQPTASGPTLAQVKGSWGQVLLAVRKRNPTTQGVLNSGCKPVEVHDGEVVIAFPQVFLLEKLADPQRKAEIQDAFSEVLQINCRVKLVLESEYRPRIDVQPRATAPPQDPESPAVAQAASEGGKSENPSPKEDNIPESEVPAEISRWAAEHGAEATVLPPKA